MPRPHLIVCAGPDLFASFFPSAQQRRLSRSFRWQRDGARKITPALKRKLVTAQALITTWDSPHFLEDLPRLAPQLRIIASCASGQIAFTTTCTFMAPLNRSSGTKLP